MWANESPKRELNPRHEELDPMQNLGHQAEEATQELKEEKQF